MNLFIPRRRPRVRRLHRSAIVRRSLVGSVSRVLHVECLEARRLLAGIQFFNHPLVETSTLRPTSVDVADLDGDGDLDILSASLGDDKIAWYENTDGAGTFGSQRVITMQADGAFCLGAADLDGDGDQDVLSASQFDGKIAWYENTDGAGTFGSQNVVATSSLATLAVHAADLDGDGDLDFFPHRRRSSAATKSRGTRTPTAAAALHRDRSSRVSR